MGMKIFVTDSVKSCLNCDVFALADSLALTNYLAYRGL